MAWSAGAVLTAAQLNLYLPQAMTSYTPTLTGTGTTQGNATMTGSYIQFGKVTHFWARAVRGSTTVMGSVLTLSLPATARSSSDGWFGLTGEFIDTGTANYLAIVGRGTAGVTLWIPGTNGAFTAPSSTAPFTWATGDVIYVGGTYEAA